MRISLETTLPCSADAAWNEVQTSRLLQEIASPLIGLKAPIAYEIPSRWRHGQTIKLRPFLFRFLPTGTRTLKFERVELKTRQIQTREHDAIASRWDHFIALDPIDERSCRYRDEIVIEAGLLTPLVWLFARWFYAHRQRRWQIVAKRLAAAELKDNAKRESTTVRHARNNPNLISTVTFKPRQPKTSSVNHRAH